MSTSKTPRKLLFTQILKKITSNDELVKLFTNSNTEYYAIKKAKTIYIFKTKKAYQINIKKSPNSVNGKITAFNTTWWRF